MQKIKISEIKKNALQPRQDFKKEPLTDLTESIKQRGILQPLLVRPSGKGYELIAGERRLMAATNAGLTEVPVVILEAANVESLEIALIENLQRENLNAMEEAEGYRVLAEKFGLTQEQIASRVGKARASVTNTMRLLSLPDEIKQMISKALLSLGHAKILTGLEIAEEQMLFAKAAVKQNLSVRNLEKLVQKAKRAPKKPRAARTDIPNSHISFLSDKLHGHFGTGVRVNSCKTLANGKKRKGSIEIDFYSNDDLNRILELIGIEME